MKQKRWIVLIVVVLIIALSGATLILANFSVMKSELARDSAVASSTGTSDQPVSQIAHDKTGLYINGDAMLARALQQELTQMLGGQSQFGEILPVDGTSDKADYPLLFVEFDKQDITWTPVYARANLEISVSYASNGDVSFRNSKPVTFNHIGNQPSLLSDGDHTFTDMSWGLISSPGYVNYLAKEIAKTIATDLMGLK